jgi:hypothetical protein
MPSKFIPEMLLSSDEDFGIILEALDHFVQYTINLSNTIEMTSVAVKEAMKLDPEKELDEASFKKAVTKGLDLDKVKDKSTKIRDAIILLKAKVVMTKEYLRGDKLTNEIDQITT